MTRGRLRRRGRRAPAGTMGQLTRNMIAVDLGASNGRVVLGRLSEAGLTLATAHRFEHSPRRHEGRLKWDWARIIDEVRKGLARAAEVVGDEQIASVSCDSWAQDFGLLDEEDRLIRSPASYRDKRTEGMPGSFADVIGPEELVRRVGSVASPITTLCQLRAMALQEPEALEAARTLLHIADLVHHDLCGVRTTDRTMATASQLRNLRTGEWDRELLAALGIPHHFLPKVAEEAAVVGHIAEDRAPHPKLKGLPVVISASHDTAAAAAAAEGPRDEAFLSCGTWSMLGHLSDQAMMPEKPAQEELAILGVADGRWGVFRGIMGLWLLQECRRAWADEGLVMSSEEITAAASAQEGAEPALLDPDDARFVAPANMPQEIRAFCRETGQRELTTPGETARAVLVSLALDYRVGMATLERVTGQRSRAIRMVGGGSANELLCQLTADATGLPVIAGPVEATALGNLLLQARAMGTVEDDAEMAAIVARSFALRRYEPSGRFDDRLCERFAELKRRRVR